MSFHYIQTIYKSYCVQQSMRAKLKLSETLELQNYLLLVKNNSIEIFDIKELGQIKSIAELHLFANILKIQIIPTNPHMKAPDLIFILTSDLKFIIAYIK